MSHAPSIVRRAAGIARRRLLPLLFPVDYPRISLPRTLVESAVRSSGADEWHIYAFTNYDKRIEAPIAMRWIARNVPKRARIFETGCGSGSNLIWLAQRGFRNLAGADVDAAAISAGQRLVKHANLPIELKVDDCIRPASPPEADVIIAMAWVYLWNVDFDLASFLALYSATLHPGGYVVLDMVDSSFNQFSLNEQRTDDWDLPPEHRRPTQYKLRMSEGDVREIAERAGFDVILAMPGSEIPPRRVYILRTRDTVAA